jgi:hypothetical protein
MRLLQGCSSDFNGEAQLEAGGLEVWLNSAQDLKSGVDQLLSTLTIAFARTLQRNLLQS